MNHDSYHAIHIAFQAPKQSMFAGGQQSFMLLVGSYFHGDITGGKYFHKISSSRWYEHQIDHTGHRKVAVFSTWLWLCIYIFKYIYIYMRVKRSYESKSYIRICLQIMYFPNCLFRCHILCASIPNINFVLTLPIDTTPIFPTKRIHYCLPLRFSKYKSFFPQKYPGMISSLSHWADLSLF